MNKNMNKIKIAIVIALIGGFIFQSCKDNNDLQKLREKELELLSDYISRYNEAHNTTLEPTYSGLYYVEVEEGVGDTIKIGDQVQLWYNTYRLVDSVLVDSNMEDGHKYTPLPFTVSLPDNSSVIEGLNEAVKYMKPGGKAFLIMPSEVAYGQDGTYDVPAFSTLLMDIEIYKVFPAEN